MSSSTCYYKSSSDDIRFSFLRLVTCPTTPTTTEATLIITIDCNTFELILGEWIASLKCLVRTTLHKCPWIETKWKEDKKRNERQFLINASNQTAWVKWSGCTNTEDCFASKRRRWWLRQQLRWRRWWVWVPTGGRKDERADGWTWKSLQLRWVCRWEWWCISSCICESCSVPLHRPTTTSSNS